MSDKQFDLAVIGAGPAGYVAAIRAAQLGMTVAIIEKQPTLGGTCLNIGCIPSKALLDSSEHFHFTQSNLKEHGVDVKDVSLNLKQMISRKDEIVTKLTSGISFLMKKNKIIVFEGLGKIVDTATVSVGSQLIKTNKILIASGSESVELPMLQYDGTHIVSSTEALCFDHVPKDLLVIGAGAIGLELGSVWQRLGSNVTVVEFMDRVLPPCDGQVSKTAARLLKKQGMTFHLSTKVTGGKVKNNKVTVTAEDKKGNEVTFTADKVLVAVGRRPVIENLGLEDVGVKLDDRKRINVDSHFCTNVENIYAIGDVIHGPMLAHKAEDEGVACAELMTGNAGHIDYDLIPSIVYTDPEIAMVGKTEEQLKEDNVPYNVGSFSFAANGRALAMGSTDGFVKILAHKETDQILGVHMIGPKASELIAEAVSVMEYSGSAEDIARTVHSHPTLSEVVREAALAVDNRALHG